MADKEHDLVPVYPVQAGKPNTGSCNDAEDLDLMIESLLLSERCKSRGLAIANETKKLIVLDKTKNKK